MFAYGLFGHHKHGHHNDHHQHNDWKYFDHFYFSHHHDHDHHKLPATLLNATVALNATDPGNSDYIINGSGNPADGWAIQNNGEFQLATDVHYRQGDTVQPVSVSSDGVLHYEMPAGQQMEDPDHNVPPDNPNNPHAATSFDWSFDTGAGSGPHPTIQEFLASGGQMFYSIDLDPSEHNNPLVLHAVYDASINTGGSHVVWMDSHNTVVIADDDGNDYVTQNSQNLGFYQSLIDTDPHTPGIQTGPLGVAGIFDIEAKIIAPHHKVVADIHSQLHIGEDAPVTSEHHHELPPTLLNATVADNATDGSGHILNGSGNPADGWAIQNHKNLQLATDVHYRQGDTVQPVAVDSDGKLHFDMPAGYQMQDSDHGVPVDNLNRAATSFDWSFDSDVTGMHQSIADFLDAGGQFLFKIDLDPTEHNNPLVLHAVYDSTANSTGSGVIWQDCHNNTFIADDAGNAFVTQNSQNYAFYNSLIDTDPHTPGIQPSAEVGPAGTFDIEAQIIDQHHQLVADIHSVLHLA